MPKTYHFKHLISTQLDSSHWISSQLVSSNLSSTHLNLNSTQLISLNLNSTQLVSSSLNSTQLTANSWHMGFYSWKDPCSLNILSHFLKISLQAISLSLSRIFHICSILMRREVGLLPRTRRPATSSSPASSSQSPSVYTLALLVNFGQ